MICTGKKRVVRGCLRGLIRATVEFEGMEIPMTARDDMGTSPRAYHFSAG